MKIRKWLALVLAMFLCGCGGGGNSPISQSSNSSMPIIGFSTSGTSLLYQGKAIFLKGIGYSPFRPGEMPSLGTGRVPGHYRVEIPIGPIDFSGISQAYSLPDDDRYKGDLNLIKSVNANFVIVYPPMMPPNFFSALQDSGLYYLQDISLDTAFYAGGANDLFDVTFQRNSINRVKAVIDHNISHGLPNKLIAFSVGDEINAGVIYNTDKLHPDRTSYQGRFITISKRTPSEVAIAILIDQAMQYEVGKYGSRHLYTHTSWTHIGPVPDRPDLEVAPQSVFSADYGDLICLNVYDYARGVKSSHPGTTSGTPYQGYIEDLEKLAVKANRPVIITQTGLSTSPVAPDPNVPGFGGNSVDDAVAKYRQIWTDIRNSNQSKVVVGICWFEFQDEFWKGFVNPSVQEPDQPEEWFGIWSVNSGKTLVPKGALPDTVRNLFSQE